MLRGTLGAAGSLALAACGISAPERQTTPRSTGRLTPLPSPSGELRIATWPLYIDVDDASGRRPTVDAFESETDIDVTYKEVIDDNDPFFSTIREPLSRGRRTGWDIIVVTDWLVGRMQRLGYLERLHPERLPLVRRNLGSMFRGPEGAPLHSVPWQAGITGIGYNRKLTKRPINSFGDLFDPLFEGKIGMFSDMRDMLHLTLLWQGVDPLDATIEDVEDARDELVRQRKDGLVRGYYENDYTDALAKGDVALCLAYSGDIFQLRSDNPDLRFVVPKEGGMLFVDEMVIPARAAHPADAHEWMNFVYDPKIAAQIAAYVAYITPVPAAKGMLRDLAADASGDEKETLESIASSPLVFPTARTAKRLHRYRVLGEDEEREWDDVFAEVVDS
jgi:spermidine/putrescine transport system substrate-binding protein